MMLITIETPAQVPVVSDPHCAYCNIKLTSSTKPWDHKSSCPYYKAQTVSSSSSIPIKSISSSGSSKSIIAGGIVSVLGSALNQALSSNNIVNSQQVQQPKNLNSGISGKFVVATNLQNRIDAAFRTEDGKMYWFNYPEDIKKILIQDRQDLSSADKYTSAFVMYNDGRVDRTILHAISTYPIKVNYYLARFREKNIYADQKTGIDCGYKDKYGIINVSYSSQNELQTYDQAMEGHFYIEKQLTDFLYDKICFLQNKKYAAVLKGKKWGLIEIENNNATTVVLPTMKFDKDPDINQIIAVCKKNGEYSMLVPNEGKYEWIDTKQKQVANTDVYEYVQTSERLSPLIIAKKNGKMGIIDNNRNIILPFEYDKLQYNQGKYWYVCKKDLWGVQSIENVSVLPIEFQQLLSIDEGLWFAQKNAKWGLLDKKQRNIINFKYDSLAVYNFDREIWGNYKLPSKVFTVKEEGKYGMIDITGKELIPVKYNFNGYKIQSMLYPQNSFTCYVFNKYKLDQKGEFETEADFKARQNDPQKQQSYLDLILPLAEKEFIKQHTTSTEKDKKFFYLLGNYDAENEQFLVSYSGIPGYCYPIKVPKIEAPAFKEEFDLMKDETAKTAKFIVYNDFLNVRCMTFTNTKGKSYTYNLYMENYKGPALLEIQFQ